MRTLGLWPLRAIWILLPFTTGVLVDEALDGRVATFRVGVAAVFWVLWATGLLATVVPRALTLTASRVVVPVALPATVWAAAVTEVDPLAVASLTVALVASCVVLSAPIGEAFVDGSSYGDERRMPLRPPVALLAGPLPLTWAAAVVGALAGPLALLARQWLLGLFLSAIGIPVAAIALRALHQLSQRWLVFVPAGFVLHDHLSLREPVLFPRSDVVSFGPALADTNARDLSAGASGLALQVDCAVPVQVAPAEPGDEAAELVGISQFLVMPSRPGHVLLEAERRGLRVTRS